MKNKGLVGWSVFILLVVGGLNWGAVGLLNTDVVASVLGGQASTGARTVYVLIGLAAAYKLVKGVMPKG